MCHFDLFSTHYSKLKQLHFKDIHRENTPSNKTEVVTKIMNMNILPTGTLNQLILRGSYTQTTFSKKKKKKKEIA